MRSLTAIAALLSAVALLACDCGQQREDPPTSEDPHRVASLVIAQLLFDFPQLELGRYVNRLSVDPEQRIVRIGVWSKDQIEQDHLPMPAGPYKGPSGAVYKVEIYEAGDLATLDDLTRTSTAPFSAGLRAKRVQPAVFMGDGICLCATAKCEELHQPGTLGWIFAVGTPSDYELRVLSNWHVLTAGDLDPKITRLAVRGEEVGDRIGSQPMTPNAPIHWDMSIGKLDRGVTVASPKKCGENPITVQPTKFADEVTAGKKLYYKVGRMSCASGGYVQTTSLLMKYKKHWYRLQNQIDFGDMSTNGDSGSLIVRASDGAITGLVTGLDDGHTIANPVYRHPGFHGAQLVEAPGSDRVKVALFEHDPVVTSSVVPGPELILPPEMPSALVQEALVIAKSEGEEIEGVVKQIRGPWIGLQVADRARLVWIYAADAEWSSVKEGLKKRPDQLPTRDLMR